MDAFIQVKGNIRYEWMETPPPSFGTLPKNVNKKNPEPTARWCSGCSQDLPYKSFSTVNSDRCKKCTAKLFKETKTAEKKLRTQYQMKARIRWADLKEKECHRCKETKTIDAFRFGNNNCRACVRIMDRERRLNDLPYYRLLDKIKDLKCGKQKKDLHKLPELIEQVNAIRKDKRRNPNNKTTDSADTRNNQQSF